MQQRNTMEAPLRRSWSWITNCHRRRMTTQPVAQAEPAAWPRRTEPESELEKVHAERAAYLDRAARIQAEFDNFRKRSAKQQQEFQEYALADAIKSLLPILDSLDRALKTKAASLEDFHAGIELIDKQFHDALAKLGVQPVPARGRAIRSQLAPGGADGRHRRGRRQSRDR